MNPSGTFDVEVVYALADRQELIRLGVPEGTTVSDAVRLSGIGARFPGTSLDECVTGIWGRPVPPDRTLQPGDRVELYRPLVKDPREARRELAAAGKSIGGVPVRDRGRGPGPR